jgi:hypothetical protein
MIILPESDEDLLKECTSETYRASGPGGQHVNKTERESEKKRGRCGRFVVDSSDGQAS